MLIANGLRKVDMQDLLVFLQVHQRQNLVEVAEHLNLSPSTVSYCLKKLRQAFDDELFIATRGGMQPTHKSRAMLPHVEEMLARINACHAAQGSFDPRGEPRTFTLCAPEYVELLILPALLRRLAANGPRIGLTSAAWVPNCPPKHCSTARSTWSSTSVPSTTDRHRSYRRSPCSATSCSAYRIVPSRATSAWNWTSSAGAASSSRPRSTPATPTWWTRGCDARAAAARSPRAPTATSPPCNCCRAATSC